MWHLRPTVDRKEQIKGDNFCRSRLCCFNYEVQNKQLRTQNLTKMESLLSNTTLNSKYTELINPIKTSISISALTSSWSQQCNRQFLLSISRSSATNLLMIFVCLSFIQGRVLQFFWYELSVHDPEQGLLFFVPSILNFYFQFNLKCYWPIL